MSTSIVAASSTGNQGRPGSWRDVLGLVDEVFLEDGWEKFFATKCLFNGFFPHRLRAVEAGIKGFRDRSFRYWEFSLSPIPSDLIRKAFEASPRDRVAIHQAVGRILEGEALSALTSHGEFTLVGHRLLWGSMPELSSRGFPFWVRVGRGNAQGRVIVSVKRHHDAGFLVSALVLFDELPQQISDKSKVDISEAVGRALLCPIELRTNPHRWKHAKRFMDHLCSAQEVTRKGTSGCISFEDFEGLRRQVRGIEEESILALCSTRSEVIEWTRKLYGQGVTNEYMERVAINDMLWKWPRRPGAGDVSIDEHHDIATADDVAVALEFVESVCEFQDEQLRSLGPNATISGEVVRRLLSLGLLHEESPADLAAELGCSESTIRQRLAELRARLGRSLPA